MITLPEHIDTKAVQALQETIAGALASDIIIQDALQAAELQPTSRAYVLAAQACVAVLLAHEIGQDVADDRIEDERGDELDKIIALVRQAQIDGRLPVGVVDYIISEAQK